MQNQPTQTQEPTTETVVQKPMALEDLLPEPGEFFLKATGKTYRLKLMDLDDLSWGQKTLGKSVVQSLAEGIDVEALSRVVYRLMSQEDRQDFMAVKHEEINEDGEQVMTHLKGWQVLMRSIAFPAEVKSVFEALAKTIGVSMPAQEGDISIEKKTPTQESPSH